MTASCRCGTTWTASRFEHCDGCHRTFSGTTAGDRHRIGHHGVDRRCVDDPASVGLSYDEKRNVWRLPGGYFGNEDGGAA